MSMFASPKDEFATNDGMHYRRNGPPSMQQTYHFNGAQTLTYGPYDDIPVFQANDPFVDQADEIDAHRRLLAYSTAASLASPNQWV